MTLDQLVTKYEGYKTDDYDGNGIQCIDLIKAYVKEVFGITPGAWGHAKEYLNSWNTYSALKNNFTRHYYSSTNKFVPQKGDILVFDETFGGGYGHVAIALSGCTSSKLISFDQNITTSKVCTKKTRNSYSGLAGVLRPKDQSKITGSSSSTTTPTTSGFPTAKTWTNGSTSETVYKLSNLTDSIGSLSAKETAKCYRKVGSGYLLVYNLNGTNKHKAGFVKYAGGVSSVPTAYKTYKNGSTSETIYADTAKKTVVGSLDPKESCQCLGKIDSMYLVCYKVNGTSNYKCGFAVYNGGC